MRKTVGIISIVLSFWIGFQSMIAGLGNALAENNESGGTAGFLLALVYLISGILVLVAKNKKGIMITAIIFYIIAGILALANAGSYADLTIWGSLSLIFAVLLGYFQLIRKPKQS